MRHEDILRDARSSVFPILRLVKVLTQSNAATEQKLIKNGQDTNELLAMRETYLVRRPETSVYTIIVVSLELKLSQDHVQDLEYEEDNTDFGSTDCVRRMQRNIASAMKKSIAAAVEKVAMIAHWTVVHVQHSREARELESHRYRSDLEK